MDKSDQRDFDSHYEYWDKIKRGADKRHFIDITHDAQGRMCRVWWDPETKKTTFEPIEEEK